MKKFLPAALLLITMLFCLAIISNPNADDNHAAIKGKVLAKVNGLLDTYNHPHKVWEDLVTALTTVKGREWVDQKIDHALNSENYVLFSITRLTVKDQTAIVGVGIFW